MKILLVILFSIIDFVLTDDLCPHYKEVECITDVNHALDICQKAAEAKGKDEELDITCFKYVAAMRADCWPCVCQIAKENDIQIRGC